MGQVIDVTTKEGRKELAQLLVACRKGRASRYSFGWEELEGVLAYLERMQAVVDRLECENAELRAQIKRYESVMPQPKNCIYSTRAYTAKTDEDLMTRWSQENPASPTSISTAPVPKWAQDKIDGALKKSKEAKTFHPFDLL